MSKTLDQFFPWVVPQVPGASDLLVQQAIRSAAIDFCNRTDIIQRVITADATAGVEDYTITPPTDMFLCRVLQVGWQGHNLVPVSPDQVSSDVVLRGAAVGNATVYTGDPYWFFQKTPNDPGFSIYPIPSATLTLGLTIKVSFAPSNTATTLDDPLWDEWVDSIAAGALAILMSMPGQPFSNQNGAMVNGKSFMSAVTQAKAIKNAGDLPGSLRVAPRSFLF